MSADVAGWAGRIAARERAAIARAISAIENGAPEAHALHAALAGRLGHARVLGVTGPPGAGKSTLVGALIGALLARGRTVAVLAVDPSSPLTGGAVLGDRVRMSEHQADERLYIRSAAARGHLGGLTRSARAIVDVLDAAGFDVVILETVGTGQSEVQIAGVASLRLLVCAPGLGDEVQLLKAGVLEIADIVVLNKADTPLAGRAEALLRAAPHAAPVVATVATTGEGVAALLEAIEGHAGWSAPRMAPPPAPRYVTLRADTLMGLFRRLPEPLRAHALEALADSTFEHGGDSAGRLLVSGGGDVAALLGTLERTAGELGWGTWRFGRPTEKSLNLRVVNSAFAEGHGPSTQPVCAPITGMLRAVAALVLGGPCEAREVECAACGAGGCRFEAGRRRLRDS